MNVQVRTDDVRQALAESSGHGVTPGGCACSAAVTFTRPARVWRLVRTDHRMPEPASVIARAQAFAASARDLRPLVLLTVGDHHGVTGHVLTAADPRADKAVLNLAQAVAARPEPAQRSRTCPGPGWSGCCG